MLKDYFLIAFNNLKHRGIRSVLTMLGIFIGIAAVVSLISLGQGLQEAVTGQFNALSADRLVVQSQSTGFGPPGASAVRKIDDNDLKIVESVSGVEIAVPRLLRVVSFEYNEIRRFRFAVSMPSDQEEIDYIYDSFSVEIEKGRLLESRDSGKIVLGHDFTEDDFEKDIKVGSKILLQGESFEVIGILKESGSFQVNSAILMSQKDMEEILDLEDEIDLIVIKTENEKIVERVSEEIKRRIREDRNQKVGEEDFSVETPLQSLSTINTILSIINLVVGGIAALSLFIGGVGITNSMYTSVLERTREIGVMKAIGAKNSDIMIIFLIESGLLGLVGGVIGTALGLGLAFGFSALSSSFLGEDLLKVSVSVPLTLAAVGFSFFVGIISGLLPAIRASKLNPVEALRA